jgi:HAD superfamily hydrolase (TIGR01490 family)
MQADRVQLHAVRSESGADERRQPLSTAAFFDLDRTLITGSSAFELARAATRAGLLSRRQLLKDGVANLRFRLHGDVHDRTEMIKDRVLSFLAGVSVQEVARLAPDVLRGVLPRIYPQMLEVAYGHQNAGRRIYICTAAAQEPVEILAAVLGFDGAVGTKLATEDGYYTGQLAGPFVYNEGKAQALRELAQRAGIDLAASYGYSDAYSDLPMLQVVGYPVAVNPDRPLAKVARESGWEILRFEKLGRRLRLAGAVLTAAAAGGAGGIIISQRRR